MKRNIDELLKQALTSTETPDAELVQKIKNYSNEEEFMKKSTLKWSFSSVAAVAAILVIATTTAFAALNLLKPGDVAKKADDYALSAAFDSPTAVNINQMITSGDYTFTLSALVSGKDITDMPYYKDGEMQTGRTYAVMSIQKSDGSPMPEISSDEYGKATFFASPLVKGEKPWQVNAATLNGGRFDTVVDGVLYRIVECDDVTAFADRGVYFAICDSAFINNTTFSFNEKTGEIAVNPDYMGASAVFDLPIDKKLANPQKAAEILDNIKNPQPNERMENSTLPQANWDNAEVVEWSKKAVKADGEGNFTYEWDSIGKPGIDIGSGTITINVAELFTDNNTNSAIVCEMASDTVTHALKVIKSADGTLTAMMVIAQ